jgi:hypothetical protein
MLFPTHIAKWPDLEAQVKNWKTDHGHNVFCVSIKTIISKSKSGLVGTAS